MHIHTNLYISINSFMHMYIHTYNVLYLYTGNIITALHTSYSGSFCVVRKCVCKKTGREYAVKIIEQTNDEAIQEMVEADIAASKHLPHHPHISESAMFWPWLHVYQGLQFYNFIP